MELFDDCFQYVVTLIRKTIENIHNKWVKYWTRWLGYWYVLIPILFCHFDIHPTFLPFKIRQEYKKCYFYLSACLSICLFVVTQN